MVPFFYRKHDSPVLHLDPSFNGVSVFNPLPFETETASCVTFHFSTYYPLLCDGLCDYCASRYNTTQPVAQLCRNGWQHSVVEQLSRINWGTTWGTVSCKSVQSYLPRSDAN